MRSRVIAFGFFVITTAALAACGAATDEAPIEQEESALGDTVDVGAARSALEQLIKELDGRITALQGPGCRVHQRLAVEAEKKAVQAALSELNQVAARTGASSLARSSLSQTLRGVLGKVCLGTAIGVVINVLAEPAVAGEGSDDMRSCQQRIFEKLIPKRAELTMAKSMVQKAISGLQDITRRRALNDQYCRSGMRGVDVCATLRAQLDKEAADLQRMGRESEYKVQILENEIAALEKKLADCYQPNTCSMKYRVEISGTCTRHPTGRPTVPPTMPPTMPH